MPVGELASHTGIESNTVLFWYSTKAKKFA